MTQELWLAKRMDLTMDLLHRMPLYLGYNFNKAQHERDIYRPRAHDERETEQTIIRKGLVDLLNGKLVIPIAVKELPVTLDKTEG